MEPWLPAVIQQTYCSKRSLIIHPRTSVEHHQYWTDDEPGQFQAPGLRFRIRMRRLFRCSSRVIQLLMHHQPSSVFWCMQVVNVSVIKPDWASWAGSVCLQTEPEGEEPQGLQGPDCQELSGGWVTWPSAEMFRCNIQWHNCVFLSVSSSSAVQTGGQSDSQHIGSSCKWDSPHSCVLVGSKVNPRRNPEYQICLFHLL